MPRKQRDSGDLTALQRRLDGWRRRHGGRGRRIPEHLWRAAARAAQTEDVAVVARVLRLPRERLEAKAAEEAELRAEPEAAEFVEIQLPATEAAGRGSGAVVVQFEALDGRRLRLELPPSTACDVGAIFTAFVG